MKRKIAIIAGALLISSSVAAYASSTNSSYDTTVGAFNGSGYTSYTQTKDAWYADGIVESGTVGGSYVVDVRMQNSKGNSTPWERDLGDSPDLAWPTSIDAGFSNGDSMRLQFSNDLDTPVKVQVTGEWRSDV